jgi:glutamate N-acetyltransferase / amino-acid N-acetyltransferase
MNHWEIIEGHLGTPRGFRGAAIEAGIKKRKGTPDLALLFAEEERTSAAAVFTTNRAAAAPVEISRQHLRQSRGWARAVVVNSGNANCATGREGWRTARETARATGRLLGVPVEQVLVASTGVIGVPLKPESIVRQLPALRARLSRARAASVERAIMTTDTFPKSRVLRSTLAGKTVHLAGIAKGAGMIHPRMATMLSFITTDAEVAPRDLSRFLRAAVDVSFHRLSVDGDTSTNDTVLVLASGLSQARAPWGARAGRQFQEGLSELCQALAKMIARDGEGARKLVTLEVCGARSAADAERIARAVANSPLVKTALAGSDPNWGRVLCAAGYSGAALDPGKVDIRVNDLVLCRRGRDTGFDEAAARRELDRAEVSLRLNLHLGKASTHFWTCDLTHDYITINASYRT